MISEAIRPRPSVLLMATLVTVLLAHSPAAGGGFIWDDHHVVIESALVTQPRTLSDFFDAGFFVDEETEPGGRGYYRPLTVLTWAVDHLLHGSNAAGYHLTNLALHVLNTALLFALLRRTGANALAASVAAAIWGTLPRLTEAVSWISGRTDVLAATFVLASLVVLGRSSWTRRALASLLLLAGLLSKEVALAGVAAAALLEWRRTSGGWWKRALGLAPLALTCLCYAALRIQAIGPTPKGLSLGTGRRIGAALEAIGRYVHALADPWHPETQFGRLMVTSWPYVVVGVATLVALGLLLPRLVRRGLDELELAGLAVAAVGFGLVLHLAPLAINVVAADRFLYVPVAGLALGLTRTTAAALGKLRRVYVAPAVAVLTLSLAVTTWFRAREWTDEIDFWLTAYRQAPDRNGAAAIQLGNVFFRAGLHAHAMAVYQTFNDFDDYNRAMAGNNIATSLQALGQYRGARQVLQQIVSWYPSTPRFRLNLALASMAVGDFAHARREIDEALRLYPDFRLARSLKLHVPTLEQQSRQAWGESPEMLLERAQYSIEVSRFHHAFRYMDRAIGMRKLTVPQAEGAFFFALRFAEPAVTERIFRAYSAAHGGNPPPGVVEAYRMRRESEQRLRELWPSLNLALPKRPS